MRGDFVQPSLSEGKRILFLMFWVWIPLSLRDVCHFKPNRNQSFPPLLLTLLSGSREKTRGKGFEYRSGQAGQKDCTHNRNRARFHARIPSSFMVLPWMKEKKETVMVKNLGLLRTCKSAGLKFPHPYRRSSSGSLTSICKGVSSLTASFVSVLSSPICKKTICNVIVCICICTHKLWKRQKEFSWG